VLQDKLSAAERAAADADRQRALLVEEKAGWAKQRKALEADAARVAADGDRRIASLHDKLAHAQRAVDDAERHRALLEEEKHAWAKQRKTLEADAARAARAAEQLLQESERRARQREADLERLRAKLAQVAAKEKEAAARQRALLAAWREGAVHWPATGGAKAKEGKEGGGGGALDVIEALDQQREALQRRNDELAEQVADLAAALEGREGAPPASPGKSPRRRGTATAATAATAGLDTSVPSVSFSLHDVEPDSSRGPVQLFETTRDDADDVDKEGDGDTAADATLTLNMTVEMQEGAGLTRECDSILRAFDAGGAAAAATPTARRMYQAICDQKARLAVLEGRCARWKVRHLEAEGLAAALRAKLQLAKEAADNLQLELAARPTVQALRAQEQACRELEERLRDVVVMRRESDELRGLRKHMSARDRMAADRRNYEMGLHLLDALPAQVAKEALQAACREVGVCDVSDLQPALQKLTAVVEAVPRLERVLQAAVAVVAEAQTRRAVRAEAAALQVTSTGSGRIRISRRGGTGGALDAAARFVGAGGDVDELVPALQRWAGELSRLADLEDFLDNMRALLGSPAAQAALAGLGSSTPPPPPPTAASSSSSSLSSPPPPSPPPPPTLPTKPSELLAAVELLLGARTAALRALDQRAATDALVHAERPDAAVSALVAHLQRLFAVPHVDGLLPRLNALYVREQEAANFVATCRDLLGGPFAPRPTLRLTDQPPTSARGGVLVDLSEGGGEGEGGGGGDGGGSALASDRAVLTEVARRLALAGNNGGSSGCSSSGTVEKEDVATDAGVVAL
jgi:hypothetical protein